MAFRPCLNREDPFTRQLRATYRANAVSAPRAGLDPAHTLAVRKRHVEPRGRLEAMLDRPVDLPQVEVAAVAGLSGVRSASVDLELGLSLSAKFLAALGVPIPGAAVNASLWQGASGFTFEVRDVLENQMDVARLGGALEGRRINRTPATAVFFDGSGTELYLITRTLTTKTFGIRGTSSGNQSVKVSVDAIPDLLGEASATVAWNSDRADSVAFTGSTPVTFAFAAIPCAIDARGSLVFGLTSSKLTFGEGTPDRKLEPVPVVDEAGLVEFDDDRQSC
jgi:hypothetical protein